ncbi:MAG: benzoate transporter [Betaproteobacteria bacterium RIFCSPLOWO2_02_FULL_63_19]|nr:MAG: benzoate transporter [Betaproteobacteria bacterium RIFCSPLOWO2_02_FULL_63_19]
MSLSVAIITHNADKQLDACLQSASFADEILIVDSGSTDGTVEIARRHGAKVMHKEWLGFGPQKQFAVSAASYDWVLCLDADERISDSLREAIVAELRAPRGAVYALSRRNRFLGRWLRHGEGYPDWCVRLFHRREARWSDDPVHERVVTAAPVQRLSGDLLHESAQTLERYLEKQNRYTSLAARQLYAQGRRASIWHLAFAPLARFVKFYILRLGCLDGLPGMVHVCIGCMNSFNKYAKLMALQRGAAQRDAAPE